MCFSDETVTNLDFLTIFRFSNGKVKNGHTFVCPVFEKGK